MRKFNCLLALCFLLFVIHPGLAASTTEEPLSYERAMERLDIISLRDADELELIAGSLNALTEAGFAQQYMLMADSLARLARGEELSLDMIAKTIKALSADTAFTEDYMTYANLAKLPLDTLLEYIAARSLEAEGKVEEALTVYAKVQALDSMSRSLRLMAEKQASEGISAPPQATDAAYFTFEEDVDGTLIITGYTGSDADIVIPGFIGNMPVKLIGESAFAGSAELRSVVILEGGEDEWAGIADAAFMDCINLTSVTLASNARYIGPYAFAGCISLEEFIIPFGLTDINFGAFENCVSLHEVIMPESLTALGGGAFAGCTQLTAATIPADVMTIDPDVFLGCENLTILGSPESYAQLYADENGIPFQEVKTAP